MKTMITLALASMAAANAFALVPQPQSADYYPGQCSTNVSVREISASDLPAEGYRLEIDAAGVRLAASDAAGFFYGRQTLRQLAKDGTYPHCRIADAPAYPWRGLMLDSSRHFFTKDVVLRLLAHMASVKLNVLHWHLTDNQGWRFPVPGYPALTEYVRPVENRLNFCDQSTSGTYGPFSYTREELKEIVARARELHVRIVPEVEIPGHSEALLSACPQFGCSCTPRKVKNAICVGKDEPLRFFERALDEVCAIFPDAVVHIGGDECDRSDWARCPDCQARMSREGIADLAGLQSWVTAHFSRYLAAKGRRLMGWDEIAEGGLPTNTMVMSWRGTSTGIAAAKAGQDVVMTPNEYCYFDYTQCLADDASPYPFNWTVHLPLAKVYSFDPARGIPDLYRRHVLGAQGNCWSEMIRTEGEFEWKLWPRAAALAEALWTAPSVRDFDAFLPRLSAFCKSLSGEGVRVAPLRPSPARADSSRGVLSRVWQADGEIVRYACGNDVSELRLSHGRLSFVSPAANRPEFVKNDFVEIEVTRLADDAFLATARRRNDEIVVTVLFDGPRVECRDRYDYRK